MERSVERSVLPAVDLNFDESIHIYTRNGVRLPSVTQLMSPLSQLIYGGVPTQAMAEAANRGSRAHEQVEHIVKYGIVETDPDTEGYVQAFNVFQNDKKPTWAGSEYRTYHKNLLYAGTLDLIGHVTPDDGHGFDVVDLKTTSRLYPTMLSVQLGAYAEALKSHGLKIRHVYGLQLRKDGGYTLERLEPNYKLFLHCMAVYNAARYELK